MKIECLKENILRAVVAGERATGKKLPLASLGKVLIEAKNKGLIIRATNLDLGVEIRVPAKVHKEGRILVSGSLLASHINNLLPQATVLIETTDNNLLINTPSSSAIFTTEPAEDFPELPKIKKEDGPIGKFVIEANWITEGLGSVIYAAAITDIKPEIASINLKIDKNEVAFASTDSFRLAEKIVPIDKVSVDKEHDDILIPLRNAIEIMKLTADEGGNFDVTFNGNQITFNSDNLYITSRLIDGKFPAYEHLIPKTFKTQIVALKEDLHSALRLSTVLADKFNQLNLKVSPEDAMFELHTKNQGVGESTVKVEASTEGENVDVAINARYLSDCFNSTNRDSINIGFNGKDKAILIRGVGDRSFHYLVMPLHQ